MTEQSALIKERNEHFDRITNFLTPRINGEEPCSIAEKDAFEEERKVRSGRIGAIDAELEGLDVVEEVRELPDQIETSVDPAEPILAMVDGLPLEVYTRNGDAAILIQCEAESIVDRLNKSHLVVVGGLNNKLHLANELEAALRQRNELLEEDYNVKNGECVELSEEIDKLNAENYQLKLELKEMGNYRDNAVQKLEELAFELEQNRIELNRNREVRALTEAERTAEQEAARQRFLDSRIKIYNPRNVDELNSRERIANLAETGEEITYLAIYEKGTYIEITEEAALAIQAMNAPVEAPEVEEAELFQEDPSAESPFPSNEQTDSGDNGQTVSEDAEPETFEQEVRRRLTTLELKVNKNEPMLIQEVA